MFTLREVCSDDLDSLYELSKLQNFINLPQNKDSLKEIIKKSAQSFQKPSIKLEDNYYLFVLENMQTSQIIGASMIHGRHGTEESPHFYFKISREHKYSQTLNTGFIHGTLNFNMESNGWSEIGGLILNPDYRGHALKLGKALSFVRFLYIARHSQYFTDKIHVELMPPLDKKGNSPLWESIGRKFLNMHYHDADKLSRYNKEFVLSLFPQSTIYETLLPIEARDAIGKVGTSTIPVQKMLEKIGFHYTEEVDPFDGGPHYRAYKNEILPINNLFQNVIKYKEKLNDSKLLLLENKSNLFSSLLVEAEISNNIIYINCNNKDLIGQKLYAIYL